MTKIRGLQIPQFCPTRVGEEHYDIGWDIYRPMLGKSAKYTASYYIPELHGEFDLETSQKLCMHILAERLDLAENMRVLEIGFGYGTLASYLVSNYKVELTGLTISKKQMSQAQKIGDINGTLQKTNFQMKDWKALYKSSEFEEKYKGKFERIISVEMIEAVATRDIPLFLKFLADCLVPDGKIVIQAINSPRLRYATDGFIDKYIFPNGVIPTVGNIIYSAEKSGLYLAEIDNSLGNAYAYTLRAWWNNFFKICPEVHQKYHLFFKEKFPYGTTEETFQRIWEYYLKSCAASFSSGYNQNGHFVFTKGKASHRSPEIPSSKESIESIIRKKIFPET